MKEQVCQGNDDKAEDFWEPYFDTNLCEKDSPIKKFAYN